MLIGIILHKVKKPQFDTKTILHVVESLPLPSPLLATAVWMSQYYATPLATVFQTLLPRGIGKTRRNRQLSSHTPIRDRTHILLNKEQSAAVEIVGSMPPGAAILHGVTGSGKTQVYIELAKDTIAKGKSVIILVPEIALTPQLVDEFSHHFGDVILTHSRQTEAERHLVWKTVLHNPKPSIIIGPRSALFIPALTIGLIVVDEAHEPSFKQEQSPRYSALRAASVLGSHHQAKVVFGSATPLVSDYFLAKQAGRPIIHLTQQARPNTVKPALDLIDMTKRYNFKEHRFLSDSLLRSIRAALEVNKQTLIFHNRRGSASTTLCENCGWVALCPQCFIPITLHTDSHILHCHICNTTQKVPTYCPVCQAADIIHKGIGTKLIESELRKIFPNNKIVRFDADTESKANLEAHYKQLYDGTVDIIIGTQIIAKGLDLPHLRVVGVIQADTGLVLPDFSSSERTFQLLAQVIGRVGRSHHPTNVIVQSYQPMHPAVRDGLAQNYDHFYATTLAQRQKGMFPPFTYLLKLTCLYKTEATAIKNAQKFAQTLRKSAPPYIQILGPTPAFYEQQGDTFRWQLIVKSPKRSALLEIVNLLPASHWQFELDPVSLL